MNHLKDFENEIKRTAMRSEDYGRARTRLRAELNFPVYLAKAFALCGRVDKSKKFVFKGKESVDVSARRVFNVEDKAAAAHPIEALHAACGVLGEAGEVAEVFLDPDASNERVLEECSDELFYIGMELQRRGLTFEQVFQYGASKLKRIYPEGFKEG